MSGKILLCTMPSISLYVKKPSQEIGVGPSYIAGALEHAGFAVDYYDFNLALNHLRDDNPLPAWEKSLLANKSLFIDFYKRKSAEKNIISRWVDIFDDWIGSAQEYKYILFAFDRRDYSAVLPISSLHFGLLLAQRLKRRTPAPIIGGGKHAIHHISQKYYSDLMGELLDRPMDVFFTGNSHSSLIQFLQSLEKGEITFPLADPFHREKSKFSDLRFFLPKYDIINREHLYVTPKSLVPEPIRRKYPKINDAEPFFLAAYKFSIGCPFSCAFCEDGATKLFNRFTADEIVHHLTQLAQKGIKRFKFYNNNINFHLNQSIEILDKIIAADLDLFFTDSCNSWVVSEELFQKLGRAGCVRLWYGVENPNVRLLNFLNKNTVKLERVLRVFGWAANANIWNSANIIYNFPHETDAEFGDLLDFLRRKDVLDSFERNEYMLLANTAMSLDPKKFGLNVRKVTANGVIGAYDEEGGLVWEEKVKQGQNRLQQIRSVWSEMERNLAINDYLLFSLRSAGYNRLEVRAILRDMVDFARTERLEEKFVQWYGLYIPSGEYCYAFPGNSTRGNEFPDQDPVEDNVPAKFMSAMHL